VDFLYAIILGVVEGVTEFLPISSTGHLILAESWLRLPPSEFWKSFTVAIQLGAILAVVILYARRVLRDARLLSYVVAAFVPTAVVGFLLYPFIKRFLLGNDVVVLAALALGGLAIILFERYYRAPEGIELHELTYGRAIAIGIAQTLAVVPGVSRAAATIIGGLLLGMKRTAIVEFSFLLAIPTMAAATGLDLLESGTNFTPHEWEVLALGFVAAFVVAFLVVKWFLAYVSRHSFALFGWYRIALAFVYVVVLWFWRT
jgi:undecaprenyl-diphosphatase